MATPNRARVIFAATLLCLVAFMGPAPGTAASSASQTTSAWWNSAYSFRASITVANPTNRSMANEPVLVHVTFPPAHLADAASELTLRDVNGTEVPSFIVDETTSGGFVVSVWLMVVVSIPPSTSQTYWLYYGDPSAGIPQYRIQTQGTVFTTGLLTIAQQSSGPGSLSYQFSYGKTYFETVLSRLSYDAQAVNQFGTLEISANPLPQLAPWRAVANDSSIPLLATVAVSSAGDLHVVQLDVLSGDTLSTTYLVQNTGGSTLEHVTFVNVLDTSQLAGIAPSYTLFDPSKGTFITTVGSALLGFEGSLSPSAYGLGSYGQVVNQTRADSFNLQARSAGPSGGALSWGLGSLGPGSTVELGTSWSVSSNATDLDASLASIRSSPTISVSAEQSLQSLLPTTEVYWKSSLSFRNVSFGSGGVTFPMTIEGGKWLPASATLSGELSYFTPAPDFSPARSGLWTVSSKATGNASTAASA
jgi:hypothetical protein